MNRDKLYGLPFAEVLYFDPAEVVEKWLAVHDDDEPRYFEIEEWSVHPPIYHMPSVDSLLEWIGEWVMDNGEVCEDAPDWWDRALGDGEVGKTAEALLTLIASKVTGRMANKLLRTLQVTPSDDPENPLIDGDPTWRSPITTVEGNE